MNRRSTARHRSEPVERMDPFDLADAPDVWTPGIGPEASEGARERLRDLRARIAELDARMSGLMDQRAALTREVFDLTDE